MPTYEYECANCEHTFEEFQAMSDKVLRKCPKCGKLKLQRLIGAGAGIIFKGSGFYETDYKRKPQGKITDNSPASSSSKADSSSSSSSSGDSSKSAKSSSEAKAS